MRPPRPTRPPEPASDRQRASYAYVVLWTQSIQGLVSVSSLNESATILSAREFQRGVSVARPPREEEKKRSTLLDRTLLERASYTPVLRTHSCQNPHIEEEYEKINRSSRGLCADRCRVQPAGTCEKRFPSLWLSERLTCTSTERRRRRRRCLNRETSCQKVSLRFLSKNGKTPLSPQEKPPTGSKRSSQ